MIAPRLPAKRLLNSAGDERLFECLKMFAGHGQDVENDRGKEEHGKCEELFAKYFAKT
jgi:hypothetical protein